MCEKWPPKPHKSKQLLASPLIKSFAFQIICSGATIRARRCFGWQPLRKRARLGITIHLGRKGEIKDGRRPLSVSAIVSAV